MATDPRLDEFLAMARAAAEGAEIALAEDAGHLVAVRLALERIGDLLRAGEPVAPGLRHWGQAVSEAALSCCVLAAAEEAQEWRFPLDSVWDIHDADDGPLGFLLQRRDEVESLRTGVMHCLLPRGRTPLHLDGWAELGATLSEADAHLRQVVPRGIAERLLGVRIAVEDGQGWLSRLREDVPVSQALGVDAPELALPAAAGDPPLHLVNEYLTTGALQKYIEGYAADHREFRERLAGTIDMLREEGELGTALIPRRWRQCLAGARADTPVRYSLPPATLAAADSEAGADVGQRLTLQLATLPDLKAEVDAELVLAAGRWTLTLEVGQGGLVQIQLNDAVQTEAESDGSWCVEAPAQAAGVSVRVEDEEGAVCAFLIELQPLARP